MASPKFNKIGKYEVLDTIGRGGMGVVFKATDPLLGRLVAIKMMTGGFVEDPDLLKRFYREAQGTASLHHPNIVTVYDMGDQDGNPYLVMEFLEGESLDAIIQSRRELTLLERTNYVIQVCRGLEYAHSRSIIHRDIKPANIMVLHDGSIKIVDFGIARMGNDRVTRPGQVMGSIHYMSPEQIGEREVDARSDIFATGVVLYQLVTYALPFKGEDMPATLMKIIHDPPPLLSNYISNYPPDLDSIVDRALAKNKDDRYQTADELAFDLMQLQSQLKRDLVAGLLQRAEPAIVQGEYTRAKEELLKALKLDPQNPLANERMRDVLQAMQKRRRVEQAQHLRDQAQEVFAKNDFEQALRYVEQALTLDQTNTELHALKEQFREAKERADTIRDSMRSAATERRAGRLDSAVHLLDRVLGLKPDHAPAITMRAEIVKEIAEREQREQVDRLLDEARRQLSAREFGSAARNLDAAAQLDPDAPGLRELRKAAADGEAQERRRAEVAQLAGSIEQTLEANDPVRAAGQLDEGLRRYPGEPTLLRLQAVVNWKRELAERRMWVDAQIANARNALDSGQADAALATLEGAARQYPTEISLHALLDTVRETVERQRLEKRKAAIRHSASEALSRKAFEEAIELLESGRAELRTADFDDLIRVAHDEAAADAHRRRVEAAVAQAQTIIHRGQYREAITFLEGTLKELPDDELQGTLADARRRLQEQTKRVEEVIETAGRLVSGEKADEAIILLRQQTALFPSYPQLQSSLHSAEQMRDWLLAMAAEKDRVLRALSRGDFQSSEAALGECRRRFGARADFDDLQRQIESRRAAMHTAMVAKAVADAAKLAKLESYSAAVQTLESAAGSVPFTAPEERRDYEDALAQAKAGIERKRQEAERRAQQEREHREAEERARKEAEERARREADERARRQAEERARHEAEERESERREAEQRERARREAAERERLAEERKEKERQQAILRAQEAARLEAERQERERLAREERRKSEEAERKRAAEQRRAQERRDSAGQQTVDVPPDLRPERTPMPPPRPPREPQSPMARRDKVETSVSELTPPLGMTLPSTGTELPDSDTQVSPSSDEATLWGLPPSDATVVEPPPRATTPVESPLPPPEVIEPPPKAGPNWMLIAIPLLIVVIGVIGIWTLMHRAPSPTSVQFTTAPVGATVQVNNQSCVSPCSIKLPQGDYTVQAQRQGYITQEQAFSVRAGQSLQTLAITLQPTPPPPPPVAPGVTPGTLVVRTNIDAADVFIDGQNYGMTSGGSLRVPLAAKQYTVRVEKNGFRPAAPQRVKIKDKSEAELSFDLKPLPEARPTETAKADKGNVGTPPATQTAKANPPSQPTQPPVQPQQTTPATPSLPPPPVVKPADDAAKLWASISSSSNRSDFEDFRKRFPGTPYADQAANRLAQLDWESARDKHSPDALQAFLAKNPSGIYADLARRELQKLQGDEQVNSDRRAIVSVLNRFEASYNQRDVDQLAAVWPTLPKKELSKYRESFKAAQSIHMKLDHDDPQINGNEAVVKCRRSLQFVFKENMQPERQDTVTIQLRKAGGNWTIESAR